MAMPSGHPRQEFSFPGGSPARGAEHALPPRPPANLLGPRAGEEDFRWLQASRLGSPDSGSGTPSPQLWAHHHHRLYPASAGSSPSRARAIAGYRREMLDLVRGLPESAYELSLRDIVESPSSPPPPPPPQTNAAVQEQEEDETKKDVAAAMVDEEAQRQSGGVAKKQGKGKARKQRTIGRTRSRSLERSVSLDTGLLIKLFLPLSVGGKKKVSPKPAAAKDGKKKKKQGKKGKAEEERWKKSEFSEAESGSRTSSSSNSSSSTNGNGSSNPKAPTRSRSRKRIGCYGFLRANKSKNGISQE